MAAWRERLGPEGVREHDTAWRRSRGVGPRLPKLSEKERKERAKLRGRTKALRYQKPSSCSVCGNEGDVEAHHPDYAKPNHVVWVCRPCHAKITWS